MKFNLLNTNYKLIKTAEKTGYYVAGLTLTPADYSGKNVCPEYGLCKDVCVLHFGGRTKMTNVRNAALRRTNLFFSDRKRFLRLLHEDLAKVCKNQVEKKIAIRLNLGSDLPWFLIDKTLFNYPITFFDYTKISRNWFKSIDGSLPGNYNITYSWNERSDKRTVNRGLSRGGNVAAVFDVYYWQGKKGALPKTLKIATKEWPIVDADEQDIRIPELDGTGVITAVRAKGIRKDIKSKYIKGGFIVQGDSV